AAAAASAGAAPAPAREPRAGSGAPVLSFRVPSLSGGSLSSEDFKGKLVVLDVWATWCGPCRMVIPHLVELQKKLGASGVSVIGLNADEERPGTDLRTEVRAFAQRFAINYPIGLMNNRAWRDLLDLTGGAGGFSIPTTIVLGRDGRVLRIYPGYYPGQERDIEELLTSLLPAEGRSGP
ncbi:MAG TPA: TlpA disulfide reductase family protein, partial [Candidatus Polarisedimenticolia bacterium]|nr:TlpA disulfide reductase family protein [Candidatus Polarisedimenticolia bacterium]